MSYYKVSKYNYYLMNENNELLIYNSLNFKFIKIGLENAHEIFCKLNERIILQDTDIPKALLDAGVYIPEDCDELGLVNEVYMNCIHNDGMLSLCITLTEDCNFRCQYCFEEHNKKHISEDVKEDIIEFVKRNIYKYKALAVFWFGGEPLLSLDTIIKLSKEFIKICTICKKTYYANLSTNGYYLTLDNFKKLIDCNVISYQVTIDGTANTHDKFRVDEYGNGTFKQILDNLIAIRDNMHYGIYEISIRTNFTKEIYENIDEFIEILNTNFGGYNKFHIFPRSAVDLGGESISNIKESLIIDDKIYQNSIFDKLLRKGGNLKYRTLKKQLAPGNSICYACVRNHYGIDVQGRIYKCNDIFQKNPELKIGQVINGTFLIDKYEETKWIKNWEDIDNECKNCYVFPVCLGGGCALMMYKYKYLDYGKKKNCIYEKASLNKILLLLDKTEEFEKII